MYLFASDCSWFTTATRRSRAIATPRIVSADCVRLAGRMEPRRRGRGRVPRTESTTIFRGTGLSKATGLASSPMPKSAARWSQYGRAWRRSRRYRARSPIRRDSLRVSHRRADRRHRGHALLDDVQCRKHDAGAEQRRSDPEVSGRRGAGEAREHEREDRAAHGGLGPPAHPDELLPAGVILDPHDESRHAEDPAPHFEVPIVELFTAQHAGALRAEPFFERAQAVLLRLPALAPNGRGNGPKRAESWRGASAPGCEPLLQTPA